MILEQENPVSGFRKQRGEGRRNRETERRKKKQSGSDGRFVRAAGVRLNENKPTSHITHWEVEERRPTTLYTFASPLNEPTNEYK